MDEIKGRSSRDLLKELIGIDATNRLYKGSLQKLLQAGNPDSALRPILVARELWERSYWSELMDSQLLPSPSAVKDYLSMVYATKRHEVFLVLFLDVRNRLIASEEMFRGTLTQTSVYPREIAIRALEYGAAGVIFSHNHPSGCVEPSHADETLTQTLKTSLSLLDVRVLDHLLFAGGQTISFAELGLL